MTLPCSGHADESGGTVWACGSRQHSSCHNGREGEARGNADGRDGGAAAPAKGERYQQTDDYAQWCSDEKDGLQESCQAKLARWEEFQKGL